MGSGGAQQNVPKGLDGEEPVEEDSVKYERRREREKRRDKGGKRKSVKAKDWILKKKEVRYICPKDHLTFNDLGFQLYRKRGKEGVPNDSKFTGRQRKPIF